MNLGVFTCYKSFCSTIRNQEDVNKSDIEENGVYLDINIGVNILSISKQSTGGVSNGASKSSNQSMLICIIGGEKWNNLLEIDYYFPTKKQ